MTLSDDLEKFKKICAKCKGHCCIRETGKEVIPISNKEAKAILKLYPNKKIELLNFNTDSRMHCFYVPKKGCPFFGSKGCILPEDIQPLNCLIYPLAFSIKKIR